MKLTKRDLSHCPMYNLEKTIKKQLMKNISEIQSKVVNDKFQKKLNVKILFMLITATMSFHIFLIIIN